MTGEMPDCSAIVSVSQVCPGNGSVPIDSSLQRFRTTRLAQGNKARVALHIDSPNREQNIQLVEHLLQRCENIESALGPLNWEQEKDTRRRRIEITTPGSIDDDDHTLTGGGCSSCPSPAHTEIRDWMVDNLLNFKRVFAPHLKDPVGQ